ncbi:uncharacterized protein LOC129968391 [Argiope bruennichi]|uniref:Uncharacterized protein n=1 Tax=Argiope bruennichi TaxID=94029 RepID=A0A8T0E1C5_ARGBR|nr:uncharacterized protein LOC129968391 [Argiope bruennichi]XP_055938233.1 uncharacterized protein LOC129968391 [Argiope bruennichi]KAF8764598.1 hypothetical protein HNY73_022660 [Argiope bruennichi]
MLIFLLIATNVLGRVYSDSIADQFLDKVIYGPLEKEIKAMNLDPASLPDFGIPFTYEFGFIPISGRVDFTNGIFNGLSRIRRLAQCDGPSFDLDDIKIECGLNFFGMDIVYDGKATIEQLIPIPFQVTGYVNETHTHSVISGVPTSLKGNLRLFEITKFGDINLRLSNLGLFQSAYNAVEERFRERVREELVTIIMTMFPIAFKQAIMQVRLPGLG